MITPIHDNLKLEYFDALLQHLKWLTIQIDEDCPFDYRTKELANIMLDSYNLLDEITHQHLIRTDGDSANPTL